MRTKFCEGEVYYRLTFPDRDLLFPNVETFVFVGKNLSDQDKGDVWYFQASNSYARFGSIVGTKGGDRQVTLVTDQDCADMLDLDELNKELRAVAERRRAKGRRVTG